MHGVSIVQQNALNAKTRVNKELPLRRSIDRIKTIKQTLYVIAKNIDYFPMRSTVVNLKNVF